MSFVTVTIFSDAMIVVSGLALVVISSLNFRIVEVTASLLQDVTPISKHAAKERIDFFIMSEFWFFCR